MNLSDERTWQTTLKIEESSSISLSLNLELPIYQCGSESKIYINSYAGKDDHGFSFQDLFYPVFIQIEKKSIKQVQKTIINTRLKMRNESMHSRVQGLRTIQYATQVFSKYLPSDVENKNLNKQFK